MNTISRSFGISNVMNQACHEYLIADYAMPLNPPLVVVSETSIVEVGHRMQYVGSSAYPETYRSPLKIHGSQTHVSGTSTDCETRISVNTAGRNRSLCSAPCWLPFGLGKQHLDKNSEGRRVMMPRLKPLQGISWLANASTDVQPGRGTLHGANASSWRNASNGAV